MNTQQLLKSSLETLLAAFFNISEENDGNFIIESNFRESKFLSIEPDDYRKTAASLEEKYGIKFVVSGTRVYSTVINENRLSLDKIREHLYKAIILKITNISATFPLDEELALALFIFRGSADFKAQYYAVDLKDSTYQYVDNFFKLLLSANNILPYLNINFRQLQPQFVAGTNKRNTQIRINLKWFYENVLQKYPNINPYKTAVVNEKATTLSRIPRQKHTNFIDRIILYKEHIVGRNLTKPEIDRLRAELNFALDEADEAGRNQKIVLFAREAFEDVCVGCGDIYNIKDRSFKMPRNDRYYFEINHVIPYAHGTNTVDVIDNLVKLCPTCHRALTPGRAYPELQKSIIAKMLNSRPEVESFVRSMIPDNKFSPVDYVFGSLK